MRISLFLTLLLLISQTASAQTLEAEAIVAVVNPADQGKIRSLKAETCIAAHRVDLLMITGGSQEGMRGLALEQQIDQGRNVPFVKKIFVVSQQVEPDSYGTRSYAPKEGDILRLKLRKPGPEPGKQRVIGYARRSVNETWEIVEQELLKQADLSVIRFGRERGGSLAVVTGTSPGWLFRGRERYLWQYQNQNLFDQSGLRRLEKHVEQVRSWLNERGIRFYIALAPSKFSVYPEHFPLEILTYASETTRFEQVAAALSRSAPDIWIDLQPVIARAKADERELIYYRLDHHWNYRGTYHANRAILERMREDFPQLAVPGWENLMVEQNVPSEMSLAGMSYIEDLVDERDIGVAYKPEEAQAQTDLRVVLIGDSYGWFLRPFFSYSFDYNFYFYANPGMVITDSFLNEHKPDAIVLVLFESLAERILDTTVPE